jgi:N-acetylglutamate synthase-like GNAT family acetyltransferase
MNPEGILNVYEKAGGGFFVCKHKSSKKIVGIVALQKMDSELGQLRRMSVDPSFRRHGIATRLLKHLEKFAVEHGSQISPSVFCRASVLLFRRHEENLSYNLYSSA